MSAEGSWSVCRYFRRPGARRVGLECGGDAAWAVAVLHRVPQAGRPVRSLGGGLSVDADQPERACQARYLGDALAGGSGRASTLRAHHRAARRRGERGTAGDASGDERGLGAPSAGEDRRGGGGGVAAAPSRLYLPAAAGRAVDPRRGYHGQAAVRSAGGRGVGYNPRKPGRPSHTYHSYAIAELRLILEVEVQAGNQHASKHSAPGLWALLARIGRAAWPRLLRGDCDWGSEANMSRGEREGLPYLFKLRLTRNAKRLIERAMVEPGWLDAGHGWQGKQSSLRLVGWSRQRRVILLRRPIERTVAVIDGDDTGRQLDLYFGEITADPAAKVFEYAVLVTSLADEVLTVAQLYRDRAAGENNFDELKNHWGWGGFTTRDLQRCRLMARIVALIYNWWTLFVRLADPDRHTEAITSRPLLLYGVGRQTRHANQTTITITSSHGKAGRVRRMLAEVAAFFNSLRPTAEQLTDLQRWYRILSRALVKYLKGRQLGPPPIPLSA